MPDPIRWPDEADDVMSSDLTVAAGYVTSAG
jgi:hypothetical protein